MAGLFLGASPVTLAGAERLYLGAEEIWPGAPPVSGPQVMWSLAVAGDTVDWAGQDFQEGDVVFAYSSGRFGSNTANSSVYSRPVTQHGFAGIHNNGNSNPAASLSCKVITAGNISETTVSIDSTATLLVWCVRGLDLAQFATTIVSGYPLVTATLHAFATVTGNINSASITAPEGGIVFSMGTVNNTLITNAPPAGYTLVDEYAVTQGTNRSMGLAYKTAVPAGAEDPGSWSGAAGSESNTRTYSLALAAAA